MLGSQQRMAVAKHLAHIAARHIEAVRSECWEDVLADAMQSWSVHDGDLSASAMNAYEIASFGAASLDRLLADVGRTRAAGTANVFSAIRTFVAGARGYLVRWPSEIGPDSEDLSVFTHDGNVFLVQRDWLGIETLIGELRASRAYVRVEVADALFCALQCLTKGDSPPLPRREEVWWISYLKRGDPVTLTGSPGSGWAELGR